MSLNTPLYHFDPPLLSAIPHTASSLLSVSKLQETPSRARVCANRSYGKMPSHVLHASETSIAPQTSFAGFFSLAPNATRSGT